MYKVLSHKMRKLVEVGKYPFCTLCLQGFRSVTAKSLRDPRTAFLLWSAPDNFPSPACRAREGQWPLVPILKLRLEPQSACGESGGSCPRPGRSRARNSFPLAAEGNTSGLAELLLPVF